MATSIVLVVLVVGVVHFETGSSVERGRKTKKGIVLVVLGVCGGTGGDGGGGGRRGSCRSRSS